MFSLGIQVSERYNIINEIFASHFSVKVTLWFLEREPTDVYALNTHGLLLERLKLYNTAAKQLVTALELSRDEERDMISINLARVLLQIGKYEEAVGLCKQVHNASFNSICHLALSLFKGARTSAIYTFKLLHPTCVKGVKGILYVHKFSQTIRRVVQHVWSGSTMAGGHRNAQSKCLVRDGRHCLHFPRSRRR